MREAQVQIGDLTLQVAVVYGTANARSFLRQMKESGKQYHFVEVMACPGGCIGGGGQPRICGRMPMRSARAALLPSTGVTRQ